MATSRNVAVFVGSLRKASLNRRLAEAVAEIAAPDLKLEFVEIGDLPHYNEDWEATPPQVVTDFKNAITAADAVLFVTPEYNRSVPGVLKNAIDVGSRPYGQSAWNGKPGAILTSSPGAIGGFGANQHLRQGFVFLNVPMLPHEAYIGQVHTLFDESGKLTNEKTREFLRQFVVRFKAWIDANRAN